MSRSSDRTEWVVTFFSLFLCGIANSQMQEVFLKEIGSQGDSGLHGWRAKFIFHCGMGTVDFA